MEPDLKATSSLPPFGIGRVNYRPLGAFRESKEAEPCCFAHRLLWSAYIELGTLSLREKTWRHLDSLNIKTRALRCERCMTTSWPRARRTGSTISGRRL